MLDMLLAGLAALLVYFFWKGTRKPAGYPPGPARLPLVGTYLRNEKPGDHLSEKAHRLVPKYGETIGLYLGSTPTVVLSDPRLIRKLFNQEVFCGRIGEGTLIAELKHPRGVNKALGLTITEAASHHQQRRFVLKALKDLGFGKKSYEAIIQEEANMILDYFLKFNNTDVEISKTFNVPVINVIWQMVASHRYTMDDPKGEELMDLLNRLFKRSFVILLSAPTFSRIFPNLTGLNLRRKGFGKIFNELLRPLVDEHKQNLDTNNARDLIDAYLIEIGKQADPGFSEDQLLVVILDLFLAGGETTSTNLKWMVLYMALYPEVQKRCHQEIVSHVGLDQQPTLAHMEKLPYCQATIYEIQRASSAVPTTLLHSVTESITTDGYHFPKNCLIVANIYHINNSSKYWTQPEKFNPERFLTDDGIIRKDLDHFMPFSTGRRVCLGESLARNELSLFFMRLVQRVKFSVSDNHPAPDPDRYVTGVTMIPDDYHVKIESH